MLGHTLAPESPLVWLMAVELNGRTALHGLFAKPSSSQALEVNPTVAIVGSVSGGPWPTTVTTDSAPSILE